MLVLSAAAAATLGRAVRFAARAYGKTRGGWRGEWAIPFEAIGLKSAPGLKFAFNIGVHRAEDGVRRCLEGTLGETWRLDEVAVAVLEGADGKADLPARTARPPGP